MVLLSCGITGDQQTLLNGIHRVTGAAVPVVGGAASDDRRMKETYVFHDSQVLTNSAVALWICSDHPIQVVRGHGWRPMGLPQMVTELDGPIVKTIAGRSAREVFEENLRAGETPGDLDPLDEGGRHAAGEVVRLGEVGRCFGVVEPDGSQLLRGVFVNGEGEVRTFAPLPSYSAVQIMTCSQDDLLDVCERLVLDATADHDAARRRAGVLLAFGCVARIEMLKDRAGEEAARLQEAANDIPTFGFYTYGEFARTVSAQGFHNATLTGVAL